MVPAEPWPARRGNMHRDWGLGLGLGHRLGKVREAGLETGFVVHCGGAVM